MHPCDIEWDDEDIECVGEPHSCPGRHDFEFGVETKLHQKWFDYDLEQAYLKGPILMTIPAWDPKGEIKNFRWEELPDRMNPNGEDRSTGVVATATTVDV